MKKSILIMAAISGLLASCTTVKPVAKTVAYKEMYAQKPLSVLMMPPINRSNNVEAKEVFHATMAMPVANAGYYPIPTLLSMEILRRESAYDAEQFLNGNLKNFGQVFGADVAFFTIIHKWEKSTLFANVTVEIEYIAKSIKTNEVIYSRRGEVVYKTNSNISGGGLAGALVSMAATAITTAVTKNVTVANACNGYALGDLPAGKYDAEMHGKDGEALAGQPKFKVTLQ